MSGGDFWSRRRAAVRAEEEAEVRASGDREAALREADQAEKTDEELLQELNLPDPDTLQEGDDIRAFLAEAVPDRLRRRALRRLWRVNPLLANLDGLIEYGEDYTDSATVIDGLQTIYKVGRGMVERLSEDPDEGEAEIPAEAAPEPAASLKPDEEDVSESQELAAEADAPGVAAEPGETQAEEFAEQEAFSTIRPPRMRFRVES